MPCWTMSATSAVYLQVAEFQETSTYARHDGREPLDWPLMLLEHVDATTLKSKAKIHAVLAPQYYVLDPQFATVASARDAVRRDNYWTTSTLIETRMQPHIDALLWLYSSPFLFSFRIETSECFSCSRLLMGKHL